MFPGCIVLDNFTYDDLISPKSKCQGCSCFQAALPQETRAPGGSYSRRPVYQRAVLLEPIGFQGALFYCDSDMIRGAIQKKSLSPKFIVTRVLVRHLRE